MAGKSRVCTNLKVLLAVASEAVSHMDSRSIGKQSPEIQAPDLMLFRKHFKYRYPDIRYSQRSMR